MDPLHPQDKEVKKTRDLTAAEVFDIQDEISTQVTTTIADVQGVISRTISSEARRKRTEELSSYECVLRLHEYNRVINAEAHVAALQRLERAVDIGSDCSDA